MVGLAVTLSAAAISVPPPVPDPRVDYVMGGKAEQTRLDHLKDENTWA